MHYRYFEWDQELLARLLADRDLLRLFNYTLIYVNGDVEQTLEALEYFQ